MKPSLSFRFFSIPCLPAFGFLFSVAASAQTFTSRAGFGQDDLGSGLSDVGRGICTDAAGNVYMTGKISDALIGNTVSFGGAALVPAGDDDGFVAKFNSSGVYQWSLRMGGTQIDIANGIATDGVSVYVTGNADGAMTVGVSPTSYPGVSASFDGFVMKIDAATGATVSWVRRFGGGNNDDGQAICLDPTGNVYVSGIFSTQTANPTAVFGAFTRTVQGNYGTYSSDLFVAQLDPATGAVNWVSTGGDLGSNDNIKGSSIVYVPALSEVIVTGSYRSNTMVPGSTTATYTTTSPASSVTLTNASATTNEDFCILELDAATGAFVSGSGVGAGDGSESGLGIAYDPITGDVFFTGSFSSASVVFPGLAAITNASAGSDNIMYGRYNPTTNAYTWIKDPNNSIPASATDVGLAITSSAAGHLLLTGYFKNSVTIPNASSGLVITASGTATDVFIVRINTANGNAHYAMRGSGTNINADDIGYAIASTTGTNVWMAGQYASSITFPPLAALASAGGTEDIAFVSLTDLAVLPVHLLSFSAGWVNEDVQVKWQTTSETDNDHFEVERSGDGRTFSTIGERPAENGNTIKDYELMDAGAAFLNTSKLYYRLKIVSMTGEAEYSRIITVLLDRTGVFVTAIMPNPFVDELNININASKNGSMRIILTDLSGKTLISQHMEIIKGFSTQSVQGLENLSSGVYMLRVDFEGSSSVFKIVK
jgi:trimeric autotransporter adhesin